MAWIEFIDVPESSVDRFGRERRVRTFKVWGVSVDAIRGDPASVLGGGTDGYGSNPLPIVDSAWQGMRLDAYTMAQNGSVVIVFAHYSNDFALTKIDIGYKTVEYQIPYAIKVDNATFGGYTTVTSWKEKTTSSIERQMVLSQIVRMPRDEFLLNAAWLAGQSNKIHKITLSGTATTSNPAGSDAYGLFSIQHTACLTAKVYEVMYSWTIDRGTKSISVKSGRSDSPLGPGGEIGSAIVVAAPDSVYQGPFSEMFTDDSTFVRPPFCRIGMVPTLREPGQLNQPAPAWLITSAYSLDEGGAASLPGYDPKAFLPMTMPEGPP